MNEDSFDREFGRAFPNGTPVLPGVKFSAYSHSWEVESISLDQKMVIAHTICNCCNKSRVFSVEYVEENLIEERN